MDGIGYRAVLSEPRLLIWTVGASAVLSVMSIVGRGERAAGLLLLGAAAVPVGASARNWRGALMLIGVPWLVFFVVRTLPQVGHVSLYSVDDWLAYQVAGYRIYMNGFWLEGGNRLFDYQPLYRWITGGLHLVFGDSSVGEVYWDAACLLAGGLVAFTLVEAVGGFRWAVGAAAATLATFTLGPIWVLRRPRTVRDCRRGLRVLCGAFNRARGWPAGGRSRCGSPRGPDVLCSAQSADFRRVSGGAVAAA